MFDSLGDRMKSNYEDRTRFYLPRRTYTILRIDGRAFHTYTQGFEKPFDKHLIDVMNFTAAYLCENIMGAKFAYVQSDEISILLTDFKELNTEAWFDGNIQKIVSVAASEATGKFNALINSKKIATFDARVFTIPHHVEVYNYFVWRQKDAIRNAISAVAQSKFSTKQLNGISCSRMLEKLKEIGIDYETQFEDDVKLGRLISKESFHKFNGDEHFYRPIWSIRAAYNFVTEKEKLFTIIPLPYTDDIRFKKKTLTVNEHGIPTLE